LLGGEPPSPSACRSPLLVHMLSLTNKQTKSSKKKSHDVLRKEREEEIEGNTNGYKTHLEAFRSISETIHSHNMHFFCTML